MAIQMRDNNVHFISRCFGVMQTRTIVHKMYDFETLNKILSHSYRLHYFHFLRYKLEFIYDSRTGQMLLCQNQPMYHKITTYLFEMKFCFLENFVQSSTLYICQFMSLPHICCQTLILPKIQKIIQQLTEMTKTYSNEENMALISTERIYSNPQFMKISVNTC